MILDLFIVVVLCICSAVGYKRGFIKTLVWLFSAVCGVFIARFVLCISVDTVAKVLNNLNFKIPILDVAMNNMFCGNNSVAMFIKGLLCLNSGTGYSFVLVVVSILGFVTICAVVKTIVCRIINRICYRFDNIYASVSTDKFLGTVAGFVVGFLVCTMLCFVVMGLYNVGIASNILDEHILKSSLVPYFNMQFTAISAMVLM